MFRKTLIAISGVISLFISCSYATSTHVMQMGSGYNFELPPNKPQTISNPFVWEATSTCTILGDNPSTENFILSFKVTRKKGILNGKKMSLGDTIELIVHPKDTIKVTASPGAEMELTNLSEQTVRAECSVS